MHGSCGISQTEVCPISMDQVAMLALQLNVPKVAIGWSCFTMESEKYSVQPNPPKYPSTQVKKQSFSHGRDHVPLSWWSCVGEMELIEPWEDHRLLQPSSKLRPSFNRQAWVIDRIYDWILGSRSNHVSWWHFNLDIHIHILSMNLGLLPVTADIHPGN